MSGLTQCAAHFHASATRCELDAGHEGNHLVKGFAQWDEPLSHYPPIREELTLPSPADDVLPGFDPPPAATGGERKHKPDSTPRRLADAAMIDAGIHPATKMPLANNGKTCGDCALLREKFAGAGKWWKCGTPDPRSKNHRGDGRDMTKRWPACIAFQPKEEP